MPRQTIVIPVYGNEETLDDLLDQLVELSEKLDEVEVVFVDDASPDRSLEILYEALPNLPFDAQLVSHSRNFGAFTAIRTGMERASGEHVAVIAADLQEPPSLILDLFHQLDAGEADVVFGKREGRRDPFLRRILSNTYWALYRRFILPEIPKGGVDVFACNREVCRAVLSIEEPNSSLIAQLFWVGYRRAFAPYERLERPSGTSAWTLRKRIRYMFDSVFSYSDGPILAILWIGLASALVTALLGSATLVAKLAGWIEVPGYAAQILVTLFFGSSIIATQGLIGCYLWRTFENTRRRPLRLIRGAWRNEGTSDEDGDGQSAG